MRVTWSIDAVPPALPFVFLTAIETPNPGESTSAAVRVVPQRFVVPPYVSTPSVVFSIQVVDPVSGTAIDLVASAAVSATGQTLLEVYPAGSDVTNKRVGTCIGRKVLIKAAHGNGNSITYSAAVELLP